MLFCSISIYGKTLQVFAFTFLFFRGGNPPTSSCSSKRQGAGGMNQFSLFIPLDRLP